MSIIGAAIAGGATSAGGGIASGGLSYMYNKKLQYRAQRFQKAMRATHYQATVEDMIKAGINPIIGLSGGGLSQTPGGVGGSVGTAGMDIAKGVSSALMAKKLKSEINLNDQTGNEKFRHGNLMDNMQHTEFHKQALLNGQLKELHLRMAGEQAVLTAKQIKGNMDKKYPGLVRWRHGVDQTIGGIPGVGLLIGGGRGMRGASYNRIGSKTQRTNKAKWNWGGTGKKR